MKTKDIALLLITIVIFILSAQFYNSKGNNTFLPIHQKETIYNETIEPMPENGHITKYTNKECIAPFNITTPEGNNYYYVLLKNTTTKETEIEIFVYPNSTIEEKVPLGKYDLSYASGKEWYGTEHHFGKNTSFKKANNIIAFTKEENGIRGITITLINQVNGNLHTTPISKEEFLK